METSSPISFGELLKMYRKQRGLTQQQLARKLDTHHNTIGAWERGDYLPATRGMILELGQCLHLDEDETHHLLEASLLTVTSRWSVPYQRNPFFTGRQEVLQQLHKFLSDGQNVSSGHMCILRGLGGMGKTQTALEYAYQHAQDYAAVFWINAQTKEDLLGSVVAIAKVLQLPAHYMQKREEAITLVLDWLHAHRDWLLVCDNVVESVLIQRFIPVAHHGSLLATTRLTTLGTLAPCLELLPMPLEESVQLLLRRAETQLRPQPLMQISTEETIATRTIASTMDGLPLALDQAAAYIEESQCCFVGFLSLLQHNTLQLLREHPASANYPYSVEKTFTLTFKSLCKQNQAAADILTLCCFLAPDEIPEALLLKGASYLSDELQAVFSDPSRLHEAFKDLLAHALLRRNMQAKTLRVHRLVQTVLKEQLPSAVQKTWVERLICVLDQHFLVEQGQLKAEHQNWNEQLLPHAQRIFQIADHLKITSPALISLLHKTATYLFQHARYEQAEQLYLHMLAIQEQAEEANHPDLILPLIWLAQSYLAQRKYQDIESLYQRSIDPGEAPYLEHYKELAIQQQQEQEANVYRLQAREIRLRRQKALQANLQYPLASNEPAHEDATFDPFTKFLQECCVLSAQASCPAADLWRAYQEWRRAQEKEMPLCSRQAFAFQLKTKGCHSERTNTHRIWHGIELQKPVARQALKDYKKNTNSSKLGA